MVFPGMNAAGTIPHRHPSARGRSLVPVLALVLLLLLILSTAFAQYQPFDPVDGALYAGETATGRILLLTLELDEDGLAQGTLLEEAPRRGQEPGLELAFSGTVRRGADAIRLEVEAHTRRSYPYREPEPDETTRALALEAPLAPDGLALDPFGAAQVKVDDGIALKLLGLGTMLYSSTTLADGSLGLTRRTPFFYREPWSSLEPVTLGRLDPGGQVLLQGLQQRRELPEHAAGLWWDRRELTVQSLGRELVSLRVLMDIFTGGAHPNTSRLTRTFAWSEDVGWRLLGPCEALAALDRGCDLEAMRRAVIEDLRRQEAAWVLSGEVDAGTPWLLDLFSITPSGFRLEFDPYAVGPYVQGQFVVDLPFVGSDD